MAEAASKVAALDTCQPTLNDIDDKITRKAAGKDHAKDCVHRRARRLVGKVINIAPGYWGAVFARAEKGNVFPCRIVAFTAGPGRKAKRDQWWFYDAENKTVNPLSLKGLEACFPDGDCPIIREPIPTPVVVAPAAIAAPPVTPLPAPDCGGGETSEDEHDAPDLDDEGAPEYESGSDDCEDFEDAVENGMWEREDTSAGRRVHSYTGPANGRISAKARGKLRKLGFTTRAEDNGRKPQEYDFVFGLQFPPAMAEKVMAQTDLYQCQQAMKRAATPMGGDADASAAVVDDPATPGVERDPETLHEEAETGNLYRKWEPLSQTPWRFYTFMSLLLMMGMLGLGSVPEHWPKSYGKNVMEEVDMGHSYFQQSGMGIYEWEQVHRFLHFANNDKAPDPAGDTYDRAWKVRPLIDAFRRACLLCWDCGQQISIDEMMIRFKGRLGWRQYMRDKPIKYGIKMWGLCEAGTGYLINFDIYCGKVGTKTTKGLAQNVVVGLVAALLKVQPWQGGHVYMDNFYTSLALLCALWAMKVHACGTVRANRRGLPKDMTVDKDSARDSYDWQCLTNHPMRAVFGFWMDNKLTRYLTNIHCSKRVEHARRRKNKDGGGEVTVMKPLAVKGYTMYMDGCDVRDQHRSYYEVRVKSHKWPSHFFYWILDMAVCNAYELFVSYYSRDRKTYSERKFRKRLLKQMPGRIAKMRRVSKRRGLKRRISPSPVKPHRYQNADKVMPPDERQMTVDLNAFHADKQCEDPMGNVHLLIHGGTRRVCKVCLEEKMLTERSTARAKNRTSSTFGMSKKGVARVIWICSRSNANVCKKHFHIFCSSGRCANYVGGKKIKLTRRKPKRQCKKPGRVKHTGVVAV